ncbi:MAG TPA: Mov34/MPN/PAD-1 family protein [Novosphingobium sp.]
MPHTLSPTARAILLRAAADAAPCEACGLLLGEGTHIHTATIAANIHPESATHFEIDSAALIAAHRAARSGGPQVLGYWHSHPNGRAEPSAIDRQQASGDGRVWAIVADGGMTLWRDAAAGFVALPYVVQDG